MLIGHIYQPMVGVFPRDSLIPHRHEIGIRCRSLILAHNGGKDHIGIPCHEWFEVGPQIKLKRECFLLEVAVIEELVHGLETKLYFLVSQLDWSISESYVVTPPYGDMVQQTSYQ